MCEGLGKPGTLKMEASNSYVSASNAKSNNSAVSSSNDTHSVTKRLQSELMSLMVCFLPFCLPVAVISGGTNRLSSR